MISKTAILHKNVVLGKNVRVEDYCIIGAPFKGYKNEKTYIGDNSIIRSHTVIYAGNRIEDGFQTGHKANVRELNSIGRNVSIGTMSVVEHHVCIQNNVRIHSLAFIPEYSLLEEFSWVGPNVVLTNAKFPASPDAKSNLKGPILRRRAKIGANVTILPGVEIAENCLIGAGSVVVKDTKPNGVYKGNPAKLIRLIHY